MATDNISATVTLKSDKALRDLTLLGQKAKETDRAFDVAGKSAKASGSAMGDGTNRAVGGFNNLQRSVSGAANKLAVFGVASGVVATVTGSIFSAANAASRLNEQVSASTVTFGDAAGTVRTWAKTTASAFGVSAADALKASSAFGAFFKQAGFADKASAKMSTTLVQLGGDLASLRDVNVETALAAISSGLAGESEPLRRLGVDLRITKVDAEALAQGFANTASEISETDRVAARYTSLLRQTRDAQGDAARTANEYANTQRRFAAATEDAKASLGQAFLPALTNVTQGLATFTSLVSGGGSKLKEAGVDYGEFFSALGKGAAAGLVSGGIATVPVFLNELGKEGKDTGDKLANAAKVYDDALKDFGQSSPQATSAQQGLRAAVDEAEAAMIRSGKATESTARETARLAQESATATGTLRGYVDSIRGLEDANLRVSSGQKDVADAEQTVSELRNKGKVDAKQVADSERGVASATRTVTEARRSLADIEKEIAKLRAGPTQDESFDAETDITGGQLAVDRARQRKAEADRAVALSGRKGARARADALLDQREANLALEEAIENLSRAEERLQKLNDRGKPGSEELTKLEDARTAAVDRINVATQGLTLAEQTARDARVGDPDFERNLAAAVETVAAAKLGVLRAEQDLPFAAAGAKKAQDDLNGTLRAGGDAAKHLYDNMFLLNGQYQLAATLGVTTGNLKRGEPLGTVADLAAITAGVSGRARGGPVNANTPYVVGERQAELFVPNQSGFIYPSVPSGSLGGGSKVSINVAAPLDANVAAKIEYAARVANWQLSRTGRP